MRNQDEVALFWQTWDRIVCLLRLMRALNVQGAFFAMHGRQVNDMAERMIRQKNDKAASAVAAAEA